MIGFTVNDAVPVEPPKPLPVVGVKTAVRLSVPTGSVEVVVWAVPPLTVTGLPMSAPLTSNWTVPGAADGEIVAVSVSGVPNCCGLAGEAASAVVVEVTGFTVKDAVPVDPA